MPRCLSQESRGSVGSESCRSPGIGQNEPNRAHNQEADTMRTQQRGGFTLIELLTVIAIISILFGLVAVAAPRVLEKAKIADTENQASQLRTSLATYQTTHGSLPPA